MMMSQATSQREKKKEENKYEKICCAQTAGVMTSEVQIWMPCRKAQCVAKVLLLFPKCHKKVDIGLKVIEKNRSRAEIIEWNSKCGTTQIGHISDTISYQIKTNKYQAQSQNRPLIKDEKRT